MFPLSPKHGDVLVSVTEEGKAGEKVTEFQEILPIFFLHFWPVFYIKTKSKNNLKPQISPKIP